MIKAASWTTKGVGAAAQDAAREARRDGNSLGSWLHDAIADENADHHGAAAPAARDDLRDNERIAAVTARLERLVAASERPSRPASRDRLPSNGQGHERSQHERGFEERFFEDRQPKEQPAATAASRRTSWFEEAEATSDALAGEGEGSSIQADIARRDPPADGLDRKLEEALEAFERRAARHDQRTDEALASLTKMMQVSEARRSEERDSVTMLTEKLSSLENKLGDRFAASENNPIRGALARLEARLDTISKRSAQEAAAREKAPGFASGRGGAPDRSSDLVTSALESIQPHPTPFAGTSAIAMTAAQKVAPARRRLGDAIAEISRKQQMLDHGTARHGRPQMRAAFVSPGDFERDADPARQRDAGRAAMVESPWHGGDSTSVDDRHASSAVEGWDGERSAPATATDDAFTSRQAGSSSSVDELEREMRAAANRVDHLRGESGITVKAMQKLQSQMGDVRELVATIADRPLALERIELQVASLIERFDRRSSFSTDVGPVRGVGGGPALEKIERRLDALSGKLDSALAREPASGSAPTTGAFESLLRELGEKIEAAQTRGDDGRALDSLQQHVERLSSRFERAEQGLATLPSLAASVRELFQQLETTRTSVEASAAHAAREVLRIAVDDGRHRTTEASASEDHASSSAMQDDQRTRTTLGSVHDMLEKVVDRLATLEGDLADVRARPATAASAGADGDAGSVQALRPTIARPQAAETPSPIGELATDPPFNGFDLSRDARSPLNGDSRSLSSADTDSSAQRAKFIDAARRAARTAQAEPSLAAIKRSPAAGPFEKGARAGLMAKSRDYVAAHKRPVLMGIAAIMMVLGTMALLQRTGLSGRDEFAGTASKTAGKVAQLEAAPDADARSTRKNMLDGNTPSSMSPRENSSATPLLAVANPPAGKGAKASAVPATTINSDPVETGSLSQLPSFAARIGGGDPAQPVLPVGLMTAAIGGNAAAQYELGTRYAEGRSVPRDMRQAAHWLEKAADDGLAPAQYRLASLYEKGMGVAQDKTKAKRLYTQAAEAGNPRAMHNLAVLLADGDGHPDYAGAVNWFRKGAAYGIHDSQYNLAILLARGLGTPQSLVQSYQWFAIAAAQNDTDAASKRDEVGSKLNASDLAVAKALALAFHPRMADESAVDVQVAPGEWEEAPGGHPSTSARSKVSSL